VISSGRRKRCTDSFWGCGGKSSPTLRAGPAPGKAAMEKDKEREGRMCYSKTKKNPLPRMAEPAGKYFPRRPGS